VLLFFRDLKEDTMNTHFDTFVPLTDGLVLQYPSFSLKYVRAELKPLLYVYNFEALTTNERVNITVGTVRRNVLGVTTFQLDNNSYSILVLNNAVAIFPAPVHAVTPNEFVYRGAVSEVNVGCWQDGVCTMKVGELWIVFGMGDDEGPRGQFIGFEEKEVQRLVGKTVEVFCEHVPLYAADVGASGAILGKKEYYIKLQQ
jgi:hypothetical protein